MRRARLTGTSLAVLRASLRYALLAPATLLDVLAVLLWVAGYVLMRVAGLFK